MASNNYGKPPPAYRPAFTPYPSFAAAAAPSVPKPQHAPANNHQGNSGWYTEYQKPFVPKTPTTPPAPARKPGGW